MKATNEFVLVIRDKTESEKSGLLLPTTGRVKPHVGTIVSSGVLVKDGNIKAGKGKKCLFHPTTGWELEYDGTTYLVLEGHQIIALP